jgi:hypothetical protein
VPPAREHISVTRRGATGTSGAESRLYSRYLSPLFPGPRRAVTGTLASPSGSVGTFGDAAEGEEESPADGR